MTVVRDIIELAALALIFWGVSQWSVPAAAVFVGSMILCASVYGRVRGGNDG